MDISITWWQQDLSQLNTKLHLLNQFAILSQSSTSHINTILTTGLAIINSSQKDEGVSNLLLYVQGRLQISDSNDSSTYVNFREIRCKYQRIIPYYCLFDKSPDESSNAEIKISSFKTKQLFMPVLDSVDYLKHLTVN